MSKKITEFFKANWILLAIILFALVSRLMGVTHAFPFITHPDEASVVRSALGIRFDPNPKHFDWPHLHFYLNFVFFAVFVKLRGLLQVLGLQPGLEATFPLLWRDPLVFYFLSRFLSALMGALTIIPLYLSASYLFGKKAGVFSAMVFAVIPFHTWHSHYALIDVPMVFWLTWSMYYSVRIIKESNTKNYLLAGLFIGLAASTKYNGGLAALMVPFAHLLRYSIVKKPKIFSVSSIKPLVVSGLSALTGFLAGTPFALFDFDKFISTDSPTGALWQFTNVGKVDFLTQVNQFLSVLIFKLPKDFGYSFMILFTFAVVGYTFALVKKKAYIEKELSFFIILGLFLVFYIAGFQKVRSHYLFISYPFLSVVVGFSLTYIFELFKKTYFKTLLVLLIMIFVSPLYIVAKDNYILSREDIRNILNNFLKENLEDTEVIIHNSTGLNVVFERYPKNKVTKDTKRAKIENTSGYLILGYSAEELENLEEATKDKHLQLTKQANVEFIQFIGADYRTGPNVFIYKFSNAETTSDTQEN